MLSFVLRKVVKCREKKMNNMENGDSEHSKKKKKKTKKINIDKYFWCFKKTPKGRRKGKQIEINIKHSIGLSCRCNDVLGKFDY